ncbi:MAG: nitroreductase family protein [Candidatus Rokuibacteriota bacterium]
MDVFEALYTTRAMRRMQDRDVPDDVVSRVLDAAVRAPSGGNFQNWSFVVIRDPATKRWLGSLFQEDIVAARRTRYRELDEALARGERSERLTAHAAFVVSMLHLADHFGSIPVVIAALIRSGENAIWPGGSIYPAVWSIQLAARALGVGSVPVGSLARRQAEICPRLGVPEQEGWMLASLVALGYPVGRWAVAPRKPAHEVTFVERWGQRPAWSVPKPLWP